MAVNCLFRFATIQKHPVCFNSNDAALKMARFMVTHKLKYFSRELDREGNLNILLVSTSQFYLDKLAFSIYATREVQKDKRSYNLKVHTCKTILDVLRLMPIDFYIDYIILIVDSRHSNCLAEVENNLSFLDSSFTREKICLVNPDFDYIKSVISIMEIWDFARTHQFNLVNGTTKDQEGIFTITKRILNLAEACSGLINGIPMVNVV